MRSALLRLIVLRLLPGRLVPLVTLFELMRLVQRLRRSADRRRSRQSNSAGPGATV